MRLWRGEPLTAYGVCWVAAGTHRANLKPRVTVVDTRERHADHAACEHRVDVRLVEVRAGDEEVHMPHLEPARPTADVLNGAAEFNVGFGITVNKEDKCVFRLVFQLVHCASGEVVRALPSTEPSTPARRPPRLRAQHTLGVVRGCLLDGGARFATVTRCCRSRGRSGQLQSVTIGKCAR